MVLTSCAFLLHRNWSARIGELHAMHGLELYCWWSVEQNDVAVNAAVCAVGNSWRRMQSSYSRFCGHDTAL